MVEYNLLNHNIKKDFQTLYTKIPHDKLKENI